MSTEADFSLPVRPQGPDCTQYRHLVGLIAMGLYASYACHPPKREREAQLCGDADEFGSTTRDVGFRIEVLRQPSKSVGLAKAPLQPHGVATPVVQSIDFDTQISFRPWMDQ